MNILSRASARRFYDGLGPWLDLQAPLEDRAIHEVVTRLNLTAARSVFEFGCGTGRVAASLLAHNLPAHAVYRGVDLSPVMIGISRRRLAGFGDRASVQLTEGSPRVDQPAAAYDAFVSNFVLDLLSEDDIRTVIDQAYRVLRAGGRLGLCSMTPGFTWPSQTFVRMWLATRSLNPSIVGGCRPLDLLRYLAPNRWMIHHVARVSAWGVPLQAVVAERRDADRLLFNSIE